jgi:two-component system, chemotaxis family, chemotaxis protein CheY
VARVLLIEDDDGVRKMLGLFLRRAAHDVDEVADGDAGLRACRLKAYDLVMCDIWMPKREGLETIRELHKEWPSLKIVAMSGGADTANGMDAFAIAEGLGAWQSIAKPFSLDQLLALVEQATGA